MSLPTILLAPLVVLMPAASAIDPRPDLVGQALAVQADAGATDDAGAAASVAFAAASRPAQADSPERSSSERASDSFRPQAANQVRIEQHITIRIAPQSAPVEPSLLMDLPSREVGPRFIERKIGKCLPIAGIAGVQANGGGQLLLFMRDRRIVGADLERACRARDFYSGFYLSRSDDGRLCVGRDTLLSRNGANCKLTRFRQLVEAGN